MKQNRFKRRIAENHFAIGHMISEFGTRGQAKMLERADLDFVLIDMEHTGFTSADVADNGGLVQGNRYRTVCSNSPN